MLLKFMRCQGEVLEVVPDGVVWSINSDTFPTYSALFFVELMCGMKKIDWFEKNGEFRAELLTYHCI